MGDWTGEYVFYWKPTYTGAQMNIELKTFINNKKSKSLFRPTDVEMGPDGAMYIVGWGSAYGSHWAPYNKGDDKVQNNEGRIFRVWYDKAPLIPKSVWYPPKREKAYEQWTVDELVEDLGHQIPVYRVNAQDELVRRGKDVFD